MTRHLIAAATALVLAAVPAQGAEPDFENIPAKYETDGTPGFSRAELEVYIKHLIQPILAAVDSDVDGIASQAEIAAYTTRLLAPPPDAAALETEFMSELEDFLADGREPAAATPPPTPPVPPPNLTGTEVVDSWLVRGAYYRPSLFSELPPRADPATTKVELARVAPAMVSYTHDFDAGSEQLSITGAISAFRRWQYNGTAENPAGPLKAEAVGIGLEVDRVIGLSGPGQEVNTLSLRVDGERAYQNLTWFDADFVSLSGKLTTDFDGETAVVSAGAAWTPVKLSLKTGVRVRNLFGLPLGFTWQPTVLADYQYVIDDGGRPELAKADDYLFAGAAVTAELFFDFEPLNGAFLALQGRSMSDLLDIRSGFTYLDASANLPLDAEQHFLLSLSYRTGKTPNTRQDIDRVMLGFGIRF